MCDTISDTEPDSDFTESVFVDDLQIVDPAFQSSKLGDTCTGVPGRLLRKSQSYIEVHASQYIIDTVNEGYKLLFVAETPPPPKKKKFYKKNNQSALLKADFVYAEFLRLEQLGCIKRVDYIPHVVNPMSCVFSKKWRCVLDASIGLNPYCKKRKITLDDLSCIHKIVKKGDFMTVSDLDSGYWHVPIHADFQTFLGLHFILPTGQILYWVKLLNT